MTLSPLISPRRWPTLLLCILLAGCGSIGTRGDDSAQAQRAEQLQRKGDFHAAAQAWLDLGDAAFADRAYYHLRAAEALRQEGDLEAAARALEDVKRRKLAEDQIVRYDLLEAEIALSRKDAHRAVELLGSSDNGLPMPLRLRLLELRARAQAANADPIGSARTRLQLDRWLSDGDREQNRTQIVETLAKTPVEVLQRQAQALTGNDPLLPWIERALRKNGQALPQQVPNPALPIGTLTPDQNNRMTREGYKPVRLVALLLPSDGPLRSVAQSIRDGFFAAYFADAPEQRPEIRSYDAGLTPQDSVAAYQRAVNDGAERVAGPLSKEAVAELFRQGNLRVPVLALNHPDSGENPPSGSVEFGLLPDAEGAQAAEHMIARGITRAAIFAATDEWAERAALAFRAQFEQRGGRILGEARVRDADINYSSPIKQALADFSTAKIAAPTAGDTDTATAADAGIFISMRPQQARLLLPQVKIAGYKMPVFATSHVYAGSATQGLDRDLDGVQFCDAPWLFDIAAGVPLRSELARNLPTARGVSARLFALGLDAYNLLPYLDSLRGHQESYQPGATGQLSIDAYGRVQRLLIWAQFENGNARAINGELTLSSAP